MQLSKIGNIGNSVTKIGRFACGDCGIRLIMNHCAMPPICGTDAFYGSYTALLMIPEGSLIDYAFADEWRKFNNIKEFAGIENIATDDAVEVSRYDIHGRLLNEPTRGINIVIYSDGTTRKEIIK